MNSRFFLPGAVAVSLHALAFLCFPGGQRETLPADLSSTILIAVTPRLEDVPEPVDTKETSHAPLGHPDVDRSQETLAPQPSVTVIPAVPIAPPTDAMPSNVLHPGPIGVPDGIGTIPGSETYSLINLDRSPRARVQVRPAYPFEARKDALKGEVLVAFTVDEDGRVLDPQVIRSTNRLFEEPTLRAVARWQFEPGRKGGRAVRCRMALPVQFSVNEE